MTKVRIRPRITDKEKAMARSRQELAVLEPVAWSPRLHPHSNGCKDDNMSPNLSEERAKRDEAIREVLKKRDQPMINEGMNTYLRDLPQLLAKHRNDMVAYRGAEQLAIAPSSKKLHHLLRRQGIEDEGNLFITCVVSLGDDQDISR
jgi:hypothetical protein